MYKKLVICGEAGVGKSALVSALKNVKFESEYQSTIGANFTKLTFDDKNALEIWDTAGQQRYRNLLGMYTRGAQIVLYVFDTTSQESINADIAYINKLKTTFPPSIKWLYVIPKKDLLVSNYIDCLVTYPQLSEFNIITTSALNNEGIDELKKALKSECTVVADNIPTAPEAISTAASSIGSEDSTLEPIAIDPKEHLKEVIKKLAGNIENNTGRFLPTLFGTANKVAQFNILLGRIDAISVDEAKIEVERICRIKRNPIGLFTPKSVAEYQELTRTPTLS